MYPAKTFVTKLVNPGVHVTIVVERKISDSYRLRCGNFLVKKIITSFQTLSIDVNRLVMFVWKYLSAHQERVFAQKMLKSDLFGTFESYNAHVCTKSMHKLLK